MTYPPGPYLLSLAITTEPTVVGPIKLGFVGLSGTNAGKVYSPAKMAWVDPTDAADAMIQALPVPLSPPGHWFASLVVPAIFDGQVGVNVFDSASLWLGWAPPGLQLDLEAVLSPAKPPHSQPTPPLPPSVYPMVKYWISKPLWI